MQDRKVVAVLLGALVATAARGTDFGPADVVRIDPLGPAVLDHGTASGPWGGGQELMRNDLEDLVEIAGTDVAPTAMAALGFPQVRDVALAPAVSQAFGFDGITHRDQRFAGTGGYANTQFSLEPPDQGLCVGNGFVLETVNTALAVYRASTGARVAGPTAINQFLGLAPEVVRASPLIFGDFTSDPRCLYDADTDRWFFSILQLDVDPGTGDFSGGSHLYVAVSKTGDPTGSWNVFRLTTTGHGVRCPCFGDQPLIGADANGFYLSTNAFSLVTGRFVGAQIYAMSKFALGAGLPPPQVAHFALPPSQNPDGGRDSSIQPAIRASGEEAVGTEFFLSSFNTRLALEDRVVVWALPGTFALGFPPSPQFPLTLRKTVIPSQVYGVPPDAPQKAGPLPLGDVTDPGVLALLSTNDHRMQQVTHANGRLWSAVTTSLQAPGEPVKAGIAWFEVEADASDRRLQAVVDHQGYVSLKGANAFFPSVGVDAHGSAIIAFSVSGPDLFPSAGYVSLDGGHAGPVQLVASGAAPEDGFTGYPSFGNGCSDGLGKPPCSARWGDYSAAATDADGNIWIANEYIPALPRSQLANWGTFIARIEH